MKTVITASGDPEHGDEVIEICCNNTASYINVHEITPNILYCLSIGYKIDDYFYARTIRILLLILATR